jgi:alanine racemase
LYGIAPFAEQQNKLQCVSNLKSTISQIKHIKAGESIGYSRAGIAESNMMLATIPIGYADGLSRILSNSRGHLFINNRLVPIIGNVCMDMTMVDISGIDAKEGDEVEIFGQNRSLLELASEMDTIPYEILTGISKRVKRVYFQE